LTSSFLFRAHIIGIENLIRKIKVYVAVQHRFHLGYSCCAMTLFNEIRRHSHILWQTLLAVCLIGYFGYHAVQGERGILALVKLKQDIAVAELERQALAQEREDLAERVSLLRPGSLDPDMLEEQAAVLLNMAHKTDLVITPESYYSHSPHQLAHR